MEGEVMKKCKCCGKEFKTGYGGRRLFCSNQCGVKWWNDHKPRSRKRNNKCIVCGGAVMPGSYYYCSDECRKIQAKKRIEKKISCVEGLFDSTAIDACLNCQEPDCNGWCEKIKNIVTRSEI